MCHLDTLAGGGSWPSRPSRFSWVGRLLSEHDRALHGSIKERKLGHAAWKGSKFDFIPKYFPSLMRPILGAGIQDEQGQVIDFMEIFLFIEQLIRPNSYARS